MKRKFYLSIPADMSWDTYVRPFLRRYSGVLDIDYWKRNSTYSERPLLAADAVVIFTPELDWNEYVSNLPSGVRKELKLAIKLGKQLYIAYVNSANVHSFYKACTVGEGDDFQIRGQAKTAISPESEAELLAAKARCTPLPRSLETLHMSDAMRYGIYAHKIIEEPVYQDTPLGRVMVREAKVAYNIESAPIGWNHHRDRLSFQALEKTRECIERARIETNLVAHIAYG